MILKYSLSLPCLGRLASTPPADRAQARVNLAWDNVFSSRVHTHQIFDLGFGGCQTPVWAPRVKTTLMFTAFVPWHVFCWSDCLEFDMQNIYPIASDHCPSLCCLVPGRTCEIYPLDVLKHFVLPVRLNKACSNSKCFLLNVAAEGLR